MMTDIEIAQAANPLKIGEIAQAAGVDEKYLEQYGNYKAKVDYNLLKETEGKDGKLILVTRLFIRKNVRETCLVMIGRIVIGPPFIAAPDFL